MGMGEPFLNPRLFDALFIMNDVSLWGHSQRKTNVSTVGIIPGIERLMDEFPQVNLAFSLHTPFDDQRTELIPMNKQFPLENVMSTLNTYALTTKRKVMLAYLLLVFILIITSYINMYSLDTTIHWNTHKHCVI